MTLVVLAVTGGCDMSEGARDSERYPSQIAALAARGAPPDPLAESQQRGRIVYEHYCQICHGVDAQGNGFNAAMLDPPPRNFTDSNFWNERTEAQVSQAIHGGGEAVGKSVLMPAWGRTLSERQIVDVVAFLRTFAASPKSQSE